jgi:hypothetical protein
MRNLRSFVCSKDSSPLESIRYLVCSNIIVCIGKYDLCDYFVGSYYIEFTDDGYEEYIIYNWAIHPMYTDSRKNITPLYEVYVSHPTYYIRMKPDSYEEFILNCNTNCSNNTGISVRMDYISGNRIYNTYPFFKVDDDNTVYNIVSSYIKDDKKKIENMWIYILKIAYIIQLDVEKRNSRKNCLLNM